MAKNALRYGLIAGVIVIILTLTGIFGTFEGRDVIAGRLSLALVALVIMTGAPAFLVGMQNRDAGLTASVTGGVTASLIAGIAITLVVLLETLVSRDSLIFVFQNYNLLIGSIVTFGYAGEQLIFPGLALLLLFAIVVGAAAGLIVMLPDKIRQVVMLTAAYTLVVGLLEVQIGSVMTLPDAAGLGLAFAIAYALASILRPASLLTRLLMGLIPGVIVGLVLALLGGSGAFREDGWLLLGGDVPYIVGGASSLLTLALVFGLVGAFGAVVTTSVPFVHNASVYLLVTLLIIGVLNTQGKMTDLVTLISVVAYAATIWFTPDMGRRSAQRFAEASQPTRTTVNRLSALVGLFLLLIAPVFLGQYITNVLDLVALYIIMGIGLNVMVGYAGLLDLGYVASFAIGAYTSALLTTPSIITSGCVPVEEVASMRHYEMCVGLLQNWGGTGVLSFWEAWPVAVVVAALTGMALGVPVLRLRGDYLAIVTLGFGEITRVVTRANITKPLLGSAQGITPIPVPTIDLTFLNPNWFIELNDASTIYYLYVVSVLFAVFVLYRLSGARLGRAWRAMRADEDVAEAMGVHLVRTKLLAFGISSAFAGLGGAIFGAQLRGIFPDSFTLLVSINVLSLIIIGGLGSIQGVVVGALMLVGLPEVLRELQDYRLLAFGTLLVIAMLLKPEGLLPPKPRQLSRSAGSTKSERQVIEEGSGA